MTLLGVGRVQLIWPLPSSSIMHYIGAATLQSIPQKIIIIRKWLFDVDLIGRFFSVFDQIQIQWSMGRPLGPKTQIRSQGMTNKVSDHQRDNLSLLQLSSHLFFLGSVLPSEWFIILMRNAVGKTNSL